MSVLSPATLNELRELQRKPKRERLSVSLPASLVAFARTAAKEADIPLSSFVAYAIQKRREADNG